MSSLTDKQIKRYNRNILLRDFGVDGQQKLLNSKVLIVGAGGLGSPVAFYLAAAGIGTLGIVDSDEVDLSNLQRQIMHSTQDLGKAKVQSAVETIQALNGDVKVVPYNVPLNEDNANEIINDYQLVVDATDNFSTRQTINRACMKQSKPFIYGGVLAMQGQAMSIIPGQGPCFSCVFRNEPPDNAPTTSTDGILGAMAGAIGSIQVAEAVKILLDIGTPLVGRILTIDLMNMYTDQIEVKADVNCPVCGNG